jgi:glycerate 2-kinase
VSRGERTTTELRADALRIALAGVAAADAGEAVRRVLQLEDDVLRVADRAVELRGSGRVVLLAVGKAAASMSAAAAERLGGRLAAGCVTVPRARPATGPANPSELAARSRAAAGEEASSSSERRPGSPAAATLPRELAVWEAAHPIPDVGSMAAAAEALSLARAAGEDDLLLCLLSGGASSLWAAPAHGLTLDDLREASAALLRCGAPIEAVNTVRKHLSAVGGGRIALAAHPARVVTLAVSDVIGAPDAAIGSGPTLPDPTTYADALEVARHHAVELPPAALHHLRLGAAGAVPETAKPADLGNVAHFQVVLSVADALRGAEEEARRLGYDARVVSSALQGEARAAGAAQVAATLAARPDGGRGVALLWGGETTVTVRGEGVGGRNQELALAAAVAVRGEEGVVLAALGTDGRDGPTEAAGALVDGETVARGAAAGFDAAAFLHANDSNAYLRATGDLIVTGPTGTNVNDLTVALITPAPAAASA